jgi:hypothetical protein
VIEVEAGSRSIFISSSAIPGSSVTIRRNLPSSISVVAGSIVFIGLVLFEFAICIGLISLPLFFEPGDFPGNFFILHHTGKQTIREMTSDRQPAFNPVYGITAALAE